MSWTLSASQLSRKYRHCSFRKLYFLASACPHGLAHAEKPGLASVSLLLTSHSYLPAIGRFLIVVTFLEDALRIITQWSDQLQYLRDYRHSKASESIALVVTTLA